MKIKRQSKIIEIIRNNDIETQEELTKKLSDAGFLVTQATVSRDIRELKLTKIAAAEGKQKYGIVHTSDADLIERIYRIFKDAVISIDYAQNMIVIKTLVGMAMAVATMIDAMDHCEIIGTIAGDDTLFCALKSEEQALKVIERLRAVITMQQES